MKLEFTSRNLTGRKKLLFWEFVYGGEILDIKEVSCKVMGWILSRDRSRWWAVLDIVNIFYFYYFE